MVLKKIFLGLLFLSLSSFVFAQSSEFVADFNIGAVADGEVYVRSVGFWGTYGYYMAGFAVLIIIFLIIVKILKVSKKKNKKHKRKTRKK